MRANERFWSKVDRMTHPDECWEWTASRTPQGYGRFFFEGRLVQSHRWSYEALVGPIPDGLLLDHLCRNPSCVNPAHLEPVTNAENTRRGRSPQFNRARAAAITHCPRGHHLAPDNVYIHAGPSMTRICRTCAKADVKARYWRNKAALLAKDGE